MNSVTIIADRLETIDPEWYSKFDAVTLFDVLEHLPDPADGLRRAAALLRPNGVLIVSTGDMDSWTWKWCAGRHWYLQTPLHLSFASKKFFGFCADRERLVLESARRIPHVFGPVHLRLLDYLKLVYWELRSRGGWYRWPQRLLQSVPGLRHFRHMQTIPWAMRVADHTVVFLRRRVVT